MSCPEFETRLAGLQTSQVLIGLQRIHPHVHVYIYTQKVHLYTEGTFWSLTA